MPKIHYYRRTLIEEDGIPHYSLISACGLVSIHHYPRAEAGGGWLKFKSKHICKICRDVVAKTTGKSWHEIHKEVSEGVPTYQGPTD